MIAERDLQPVSAGADADIASVATAASRGSIEDLLHDLKGPLGSIRGLLSLVLLETNGPLTPTQRDLLEHAHAASDRLLDTLGDVAREPWPDVDVDAPRFGPTDLLAIAREAMARHRYGAATRGIQILSSGIDAALPKVHADPVDLERVLENLIQNAVKFSRIGGRVWVETSLESGRVRCSVHDEGVGIPSWALPHVFERRFRVESGGDTRDGSGLGLAICRRIVESHGGEITVESAEGRGTTVSFTLALADGVPLVTS